jgi:tRNA(fMet)-specific endonuclease VapC
MKLYMLDTNTVSYAIKGHQQVTQHLLGIPMHSICISAITAGELAFGLAKRPEAVVLKATVEAFLVGVEVLAWSHDVAQTYGSFRTKLQNKGTPLSPLDMQIAAHAFHINAILVSSDKAFSLMDLVVTEDWTKA